METNVEWAAVQVAAQQLLLLDEETVNQILVTVADVVGRKREYILRENVKDLERMDAADPKYDRLKLTEARLLDMAADVRNVATLPSPVGRLLKQDIRPNGLRIRKVSVPFGIIGIIYEARPNVTLDVFALCLKSRNACVLKGGGDADNSNRAIITVIHEVLMQYDLSPHVAELLPSTHEATNELLHAQGKIDLLIPRGGKGLIDFVRANATVPVIETGAGVCHTYFDKSGDVTKGAAIINNAKTRRVSVCNALDTLLIHVERLDDLLALCEPLQASSVIIYADEQAYEELEGIYPADLLKPKGERDYGTEFLDYAMDIKTVQSMNEAVEHIRRYSSKHSECIITEDKTRAEQFCRLVDAACVYVNAPTSFTDGAQFGLGAEIGISTQKLHARGPMGLEELTTYKWIIGGDGQVRE
ncbi:MAG: glutamate-5-semialdehyde dehydrogenase [Mediterranea sp.]|nr:glutamate-5-semialdehyde dehydrogenase [Mediterranea sp.]